MLCTAISLADAVRPESRDAIRALHEAGVERIVMLTGDNKPTAEGVAREVGIEEVHAELLPAEKVAAVEDLVRRFQFVAMIGDGVNDAPPHVLESRTVLRAASQQAPVMTRRCGRRPRKAGAITS